MDMDFKNIIFLLIWGYVIFRAVNFKLEADRKKKEPEDEPQPIEIPEENNSTAKETQSDYDFAALRKRIQDSWQTKEVQESVLPDITQEVYEEKETSKEEENPYQAYLEHSGERKKKTTVPTAAIDTPVVAFFENKIWTENDVRTWVKYNAIFGEPRSKKKWVPFEM